MTLPSRQIESFVLSLCRNFANPEIRELWKEENGFVAEGIDWPRLLGVLRSQRILPFAGIALAGRAASRIPVGVLETLRAETALAEWENRVKRMEYAKISGWLDAIGSPYIPLKGICLSHEIYADCPYRTMVDVDVFVREEDLPSVQRELLRRGFSIKKMKNRWQAELLMRASGKWSLVCEETELDLHWAPWFLLSAGKTHIDWKRFWDASEPRPGLGKNARVFSGEDQSLYLLLQMANDFRGSIPFLIQLLDLSMTLKKYRVAGATVFSRACRISPQDVALFASLTEAAAWIAGEGDDGEAPLLPGEFIRSELPPLPKINPDWVLETVRERLLYKAGYLIPSKLGTPLDLTGHWLGHFLKWRSTRGS